MDASLPYFRQHCNAGGRGGSDRMNRRKPTPLTLLFLTSHTRGDGETSDDDKMITTSKFRPHRKHDIFIVGVVESTFRPGPGDNVHDVDFWNAL